MRLRVIDASGKTLHNLNRHMRSMHMHKMHTRAVTLHVGCMQVQNVHAGTSRACRCTWCMQDAVTLHISCMQVQKVHTGT